MLNQIKVELPPGVARYGTELESKGRWRDASLVRWRDGQLIPIGGWTNFNQQTKGAELLTSNDFETLGSEPVGTWFYYTDLTSPPSPPATTTFTVGAGGGYEFDVGSSSGELGYYFYTTAFTPTIDSRYRLTLDITVNEAVEGVILGVTYRGAVISQIRPQAGRRAYVVDATYASGFAIGGVGFYITQLATNVTSATMTVHSAEMSVVTSPALTYGVPRGAHAWLDQGGAPHFAYGTSTALVAIDGTKAITAITPAALDAGVTTSTVSTGYGAGPYGDDQYGVARIPDTTTLPAATNWSLDNWGENLIAVSDADLTIYEWAPDSGAAAVVITPDPTPLNEVPSCKGIVVTAERFIFALAANGDPREIKWCDREDNTMWLPQPTNEAGDFPLSTDGEIITGLRVRGRTLILTTDDAFVATYQGPPIVYGFQKVGDACGIAARNLATSVGTTAFWMGVDSFYVYDGSTVRALDCEVEDYVFRNINRLNISHAFCVSNEQFNEIWWFYPGNSSVENNRYVWFNYADGTWGIGEMARYAGVGSSVWKYPLWMTDEYIYQHEYGYEHVDAGGSSPAIYAESGPFNINEGEAVTRVMEMRTEEGVRSQASMTFKTNLNLSPDAIGYSAESTHGPYSLNLATGRQNVRFTGRQVKVRIDGTDGVDWRVGDVHLGVATGGRR